MRAIASRELQAFRDNANHWKIDPEDLDRWAGHLTPPTGHGNVTPSSLPSLVPTSDDAHDWDAKEAEVRALTLRAATAEARLEVAEEHVRELREDRDHWRVMASRLADRGVAPEHPSPQRRRWWPWRRS